MKINFLYKTLHLYGNNFRYIDFFNFLSDNNIEFSINDTNLSKYDTNIIDIIYYYNHSNNFNEQLNDNCFIFCGSSYKIVELESKNIKLDYTRFLTHNLYYAHLLKCVFFPMFLYKTDIIQNRIPKYKYGMFLSPHDSSYLVLPDILNEYGISIEEILFMDREKLFNKYNTTSDKNKFYSNIECFLDIANDYNNRHVTSRTYLELIANDIPIHIVSYCNSEAVTFKLFNHLVYEKIFEAKDFNIYNVKYNNYYFNTQNYSKYILNSLLNNLSNKNLAKLRQLKSNVEEYSN